MSQIKNGNKKNVRLYKKVRNTTAWGSVALLFALLVFFNVLVVYMSGFVLEYIFESKFAEGYSQVESVAKMYEYGSDDESIMELIRSGDTAFVVTDKSGAVIYENGRNTCGTNSGVIKMSNGAEEYMVYQDSEAGFFYPKEDGTLGFKWKSIFKWAISLAMMSERETISESEEYSIINGVYVSFTDEASPDTERSLLPAVMQIESIQLPLWISADINGGEQQFIGRAYLGFNMRDNILACELITAVITVIFIIALVMTIYIIRTAVNYRRVVNLFYRDPVTEGHNWIWFVRNGEDKVRSIFTKRESFAVVNLVFRNYRNYCLCHSLADGEVLLADIDRVLLAEMRKNEMCAHATMSNFALLLHYDNDAALAARLRGMIMRLHGLGQGHSFEFQAGADTVLPQKEQDGRIVRRKDFSIEQAYNNACSARATLGKTEKSGVRIFDSSLLEAQRWDDTVREKQWSALNNEEFEVYYQPKFDPRTNTLRGAEALIRWNSPEYGFVTPGRFIPIFEKNGFITEIDHYMISHVARDQKSWLEAGYGCVPVSVNVSRAHFVENDLAEQIRDMVDRYDCPRELLEIELTESAFFDDKNAMISTIKKLKEYGFAVSMDDFGAGYSSLNSLKDMPLDVLKLDADFFRGEGSGDRGEIVVAEAIKLAKNLNMRTVAEGVEEKSQVDFLAEQGCDMIQGFYYAKPMPKSEYAEKMSRQTNG